MKSAPLILLIALILTACAGPTSYRPAEAPAGVIPSVHPVTIDADFSDAHREAIRAAFEEWNHVLNGYAVFEVVNDHATLEELQAAVDTVQISGQGRVVAALTGSDNSDPNTLAYVPGLGEPFILVYPEVVGVRNLKAIILHEIGHTLDLDHIMVAGTLMSPSYTTGAPCVDQLTVMALASIRPRWRLENMRFCTWPAVRF